MPPAPRKAGKKEAKKSPGLPASNKDARRTYEHLGRVQALAGLAVQEATHLTLLVGLAESAFGARDYRNSAELLRAAEHLCFASLQAASTESVAPELGSLLQQELAHLLERAEDHAGHHAMPEPLRALLERMKARAGAAQRNGSHRAALEFARGAEALAHVDGLNTVALPAAPSGKRLKG